MCRVFLLYRRSPVVNRKGKRAARGVWGQASRKRRSGAPRGEGPDRKGTRIRLESVFQGRLQRPWGARKPLRLSALRSLEQREQREGHFANSGRPRAAATRGRTPEHAPPNRETTTMGIFRFRYIDHSLDKKRPGVRKRIEESRKRFQCDLLEFWRRCGPRCRQNRRCSGNPYACFRRNHAAMPKDHKHWRQAMVLAGTEGTGTAERALRSAGLSLPGKSPPGSANPPRSSRAVEARLALVPARQEPDPVRTHEDKEQARIRRELEILSRLSPEQIATLETNLRAIGQSLPPGFRPARTSPPPSSRAAEAGPGLVPEHQASGAVLAHRKDEGELARSAAGPSGLSPEGIAGVNEKRRSGGPSLPAGAGSRRGGLSPSRQVAAEAPAVTSKVETPPSIEAFNQEARKGMDYDDVVARLRALGASV